MIYEFNPEDARRFALETGISTRKKGNELEFLFCPYCRGGKGDKNTFSINLTTGQFECKRASCGIKGNMITIARDFNFDLSEEVSRYFNVNNYNSKFRTFKQKHIESKDAAIEYMKSRGISEEITKKYEITVKEGQENVLVFPFKDENNELRFIKYRNTAHIKGQGSKEWCEANTMPILFGMNHCTTDKPLVITEGQIDSLSLAEAGIQNAVSVPTGKNGFTWIPHCWDWLQQFKELIIFGDNENGNITLSELSKRFQGICKIVRREDYIQCKDANEILQKHGKLALTNAVNNAELVPDEHIKDLSTVRSVDLDTLECIHTQIKEIDELLYGGLHVGEVTVLTGKRGDGKSTFMSQLIANALDQNYDVFAYSGELVDFYFKNWLDRQIAGKKVLRNSEIDQLNRYYQNRVMLYDNSIINDKSEMDILLETIEKAITRYSCRFICIDNLMTAVDSNSNETLYRAQSQFVGKLKEFAQRFSVIILLVAHPRKTNGYEFQNDDVSGSSDITNKVDIVMSYSRPKYEEDREYDEAERELKITKNRLGGKLTSARKRIFLYYSDDSKRIVGSDKNFARTYNWKDTEATYAIEEYEGCPFEVEDSQE